MSSFISMLVRHGGNASRIAKVRDINDFPSHVEGGYNKLLLTETSQETAFKLCKNLLSLYGELIKTRYLKEKSDFFGEKFLDKCISKDEFEKLNTTEKKIVKNSITTVINNKLKDIEGSLGQYRFTQEFLKKEIKSTNNESLLNAMLILSQNNEDDSVSLYISLKSSKLQEEIRDQMIFSSIRNKSSKIDKEYTELINENIPSIIDDIILNIQKNLQEYRKG